MGFVSLVRGPMNVVITLALLTRKPGIRFAHPRPVWAIVLRIVKKPRLVLVQVARFGFVKEETVVAKLLQLIV